MEEQDLDKLVEKYDYQTKLDIACWVMSKVDQFGHEPGSFRYFIYHLLGFEMDAYVPMFLANAMNFTNEFDYTFKEELRRLITEEKIESKKIKNFLGLCDTSECYETASRGTPSKEGYRWTCGKHAPTE